MKEVRTQKLVKLIRELKKYCSEMEVSDQLAYVVQLLHAAVKANQSEALYHSNISTCCDKQFDVILCDSGQKCHCCLHIVHSLLCSHGLNSSFMMH